MTPITSKASSAEEIVLKFMAGRVPEFQRSYPTLNLGLSEKQAAWLDREARRHMGRSYGCIRSADAFGQIYTTEGDIINWAFKLFPSGKGLLTVIRNTRGPAHVEGDEH